MGNLQHWKICSKLTPIQAALLIAELDPNDYRKLLQMDIIEWPDEVIPILQAIQQDIITEELPASYRKKCIPEESVSLDDDDIFYYCESYSLIKDIDNNSTNAYFILPEIDWDQTYIKVTDLIIWLRKKDYPSIFFDTIEKRKYPLKLQAAIDAFEHYLNNYSAESSSREKTFISDWLEKNYEKYSLIDNITGEMSKSTIESISRIANPDPKGGRKSSDK